jgi:hypothetical protein
MPDPNLHVTSYLTYYLDLVFAPKYAVLVDGAWGAGKTHLIAELLELHFKDSSKYGYISPYGISTREQFDAELLYSVYPLLDSQMAKVAACIANAGLRFVRIERDIKITDVFKKPLADVYVFDDLERCAIPIPMILSYINEMVEQYGRKVIVIANSAEIQEVEGKSFAVLSEKIIGKALVIEPNILSALRAFIERLGDSAATEWCRQNIDEIS